MPFNLVLEFIIDIFKDHIVNIRTQMSNGSIKKVKLILDTKFFEMRTCGCVKFAVLTTVLNIDFVYIFHKFDGFFLADVLVKSATEIICYIILTVGKCTCTAETAHNSTGFALNTRLNLVAVNRAFSLCKLVACLKHGNL